MDKWYKHADAAKEQRNSANPTARTTARAVTTRGTREKAAEATNQKQDKARTNWRSRGKKRTNHKKVKIARQDLPEVDKEGNVTTRSAPAAEAADGTVSIVGVPGHYM